jgi:hypothetical protein
MTTAVTTRPVTTHPLCSEFLYLVKAAPPGPLAGCSIRGQALPGMRADARSPAVARGRAGQIAGGAADQREVSSPDGQVSGMAGSEQRCGTCVAS